MRIAQVTYSTRPRGGVVHTLALSEALARQGHAVTVWTLGRGDDEAFFRPIHPAVSVRVEPFPAIEDETVDARIERSIRTMAEAFEPDAYDVVHAQDCISANAVPATVRTIHHLDAFTTPRLIECHDRAIREPPARLAVSRAVAAEVRDLYGLEPTVIPNGVDAERFAAAGGGEEWRDRFGHYVLAVGGIEPRKGSIDLLEAWARHPERALVFCGGETLFDYRDYRAAFEARAVELGVEPVILGTVPHDDVPSLIAGADVLAFVSTKEGFGLAAMEALAAGTPVVARDLPVLREVFGDAVVYASDVDGVARALVGDHIDPAVGRALAASYSWDAAASATVDFYDAVLARGGDGGAPLDLARLR